MFRNTSVDKKYTSSIRNIDDYFLNARNPFNKEYLSLVLSMDPSLLERYNSWYSIDNKLYYFKDTLIFNELFLSELIKEYNLKSAKYSLATTESGIGIISESVKEKGRDYLEYDSYFKMHNVCAPSSIGELDSFFQDKISDKNREELINSFLRLTAFDWYSGQTDRSEKNIVFDTTNGVHLAPIFDCGSALQSSTRISDYAEYNSMFERLSFPTDENISYEHEYLFYLINKYKELYEYLCKTLDISINRVLKNTIEKYKLCVPLSDRKELISFFDTKKRILEHTLSLAKRYK